MKSVLFFLGLLGSSLSHAEGPDATTITFGPELQLTEALTLVEEFVRSHQVDVSAQFIQSAQLAYDDGLYQKGRFWRISWGWKMPRMGGEYGVRLYMNKQIVPEIAGP